VFAHYRQPFSVTAVKLSIESDKAWWRFRTGRVSRPGGTQLPVNFKALR
jgi:hypothetical protein